MTLMTGVTRRPRAVVTAGGSCRPWPWPRKRARCRGSRHRAASESVGCRHRGDAGHGQRDRVINDGRDRLCKAEIEWRRAPAMARRCKMMAAPGGSGDHRALPISVEGSSEVQRMRARRDRKAHHPITRRAGRHLQEQPHRRNQSGWCRRAARRVRWGRAAPDTASTPKPTMCSTRADRRRWPAAVG